MCIWQVFNRNPRAARRISMTLLEGFERKQRLRSLARKLLIGSFKQRSDMCARRAPHATLESPALNAPLTPLHAVCAWCRWAALKVQQWWSRYVQGNLAEAPEFEEVPPDQSRNTICADPGALRAQRTAHTPLR